jgi:hypothetical protein
VKTIILCPGPSLAAATPAIGPHDLVIAVNRAARAFDCGVWAAADDATVMDNWYRVLGRAQRPPILLTIERTPRQLPARWPAEIVIDTQLANFLPAVVNNLKYSATMALVYAAWQGYSQIEVYGADWRGELDFDGVAAGKTRDDARWDEEGAIWGRIVKAIDAMRITVSRHIAIESTHTGDISAEVHG